MAPFRSTAFSKDGEYFASCSEDGRLKIWETTSGILKQDYTPELHLSAGFTCMAWGPGRSSSGSAKKKKKKKHSSVGDLTHLELVAMGTESGSVLLYSVAKGDIQTKMKENHFQKVNGLCWDEDYSELYSCSSDRRIIVWNIVTGDIKRKWKAGNSSISSVLLLPGRRLLTASKKIKLWDLEKTEVIQSFTGHTTDVFQISPVTVANEVEYFVSAARDERLINAWCLSKDPDAVVSFSVTDEPVSIHTSTASQQEEPSVLAAVTRDGALHIFEHHLNGSSKKPLKPKVTLQITSAEKKTQIPILCAHICNDTEENVIIVYGSHLRLAFEKITYRSCERVTCLVREDPSSIVAKLKRNVTKIKTPEIPKDVKTLTPSVLMPNVDGMSNLKESKKRKKQENITTEQLPMEERLNAMVIDKPSEPATVPPKTDNLSVLLVQGLHSKNNQIIKTVLDREEEDLITNTVRRLPLQVIVPLLQKLKSLMHEATNHAYVKWVRSILQVHTSYLISCPDVEDTMSPMFALLEARTVLFPQMSQLRGKLNLMLGQISDREDVTTEVPSEALLVYHDESSDEGSDMKDDQPVSESEDHWDEMSVDEQSEDSGDSEMDADIGQNLNEGMEMDRKLKGKKEG